MVISSGLMNIDKRRATADTGAETQKIDQKIDRG